MQKEKKKIQNIGALRRFLFRAYHACSFKTTRVEDPEQKRLGMTTLFNSPLTCPTRFLSFKGKDTFSMRGYGFTLIELLVVVLIMGILAAIAIPQYQLAVEKSRFATLKNLTKSILEAQEIYYMEHGTYSKKFDELVLEMPSGFDKNASSNGQYIYAWGSCAIYTRESDVYVRCSNDKMRLQAYPTHAPAHSNDITCMSKGSAADSIPAKICKQETGHADDGRENGGYRYWFYQ